MNLVFAFIVYALLFIAVGVDMPSNAPVVGGVSPGLPAAEAGLLAGDRITAVNGQPITTWEELSKSVLGSNGERLHLQVGRESGQLTLDVTPALQESRNLFGESMGSVYRIGIEASHEWTQVGPVKAVDFARVTQLINKTNQFNPTTRRCTTEELAAIAAAPEAVTLQFRLFDRFGDNGLISVLILRPDPGRPDVLEIETWVMSCRVFGRELEFEAMNIAVEIARRRGARALRANYIPTKKNGVIRDLYPSLGFTRANEEAPANAAIHWSLNLAEYVARKTHIDRLEK